MGLSGAGGAVQQDAAFEMLAAGQQAAGVPAHAEDLPLDVVEYVVGQNDLVAGDSRALEEAQRGRPPAERLLRPRAEHLGADADHLAAEDTPLAGQRLDLVQDGLDPILFRAADLEHHFGVRAARYGLQHDSQPGSGVVHQVDAVADTRVGLPVGAAGHGHGHHAAEAGRAERVVVGRLEEIADPDDLHVAHHPDAGDAEHLVRALAARLQPGLQADLDVDVLVGRPRGRDRGQDGRVRAQVVYEQPPQRLVFGPRGMHRPVDQAPRQAADIGQFGGIGRPGIQHISSLGRCGKSFSACCNVCRVADALPGRPAPLGATPRDGGTNFAVASGLAQAVDLCLFDESGTETRVRLPEYDDGVWHGFLPGTGPGQAYGYRVQGPWDPGHGLRCNPAKLLLDPYARSVHGEVAFGPEVLGHDAADPDTPSSLASAGHVPRSIVTDGMFRWGADEPLRRS